MQQPLGECTVSALVELDQVVEVGVVDLGGARSWITATRCLSAHRGLPQANQDKGDKQPAGWMPPNRAFWCQYAVRFAEVLRGYGLPVDAPSATVLRDAAATCPAA
ncbi:MAG TPA: hypothetical protein VFH65_28705 [Mycobacterium sp.]|nr:hypothetical protein [Mycobacterium sp.]